MQTMTNFQTIASAIQRYIQNDMWCIELVIKLIFNLSFTFYNTQQFFFIKLEGAKFKSNDELFNKLTFQCVTWYFHNLNCRGRYLPHYSRVEMPILLLGKKCPPSIYKIDLCIRFFCLYHYKKKPKWKMFVDPLYIFLHC